MGGNYTQVCRGSAPAALGVSGCYCNRPLRAVATLHLAPEPFLATPTGSDVDWSAEGLPHTLPSPSSDAHTGIRPSSLVNPGAEWSKSQSQGAEAKSQKWEPLDSRAEKWGFLVLPGSPVRGGRDFL